MLILALDTSTSSGSIALVRDGRTLALSTTPKVGTHSKWLMPSISALMDDAGAELAEVDCIAIINGPGSFTGLRIGVSIVKGLAWALSKPVVSVSSLKALAYNLSGSGSLVCPVIDARKDEVYAALYRFGPDGPESLVPDMALAPELLVERLAGFDGPIEFCGNALNTYKELFARVKGASFAAEELWTVDASNVALIASMDGAPDPSALIDPSALTPLYHRKSEAELKSAKNVKI